MRQFALYTLAVTMILGFVLRSVILTLHIEGGGVSGSDLLDQGTLKLLNLQQVSIGGTVTKINLAQGEVFVHNRQDQVLRVLFAPGASFLENGAPVTADQITIGSHLNMQARHPGSQYIAYKIRISPHHRALGGVVFGNNRVLTIVDHQNQIWLVRLQPHAAITTDDGSQFHPPFELHTHLVAYAYPDPTLPGIYLAAKVLVLRAHSTQRFGGIISTIRPSQGGARQLIVLYSRLDHQQFTVEVTSHTTILLSRFAASVADMRPGDHLTVTGKPDSSSSAPGPHAVIARLIRINSPAFGGVIAAISVDRKGGVVLTVRAHHGHLLRIDAGAQTLVYTNGAGGNQSAHVLDLLVGEHIAARGTRAGKFELAATAIHVYPHQHTVGGAVASILPGRIRIMAANHIQYIIHTTSSTSYTLNGKKTAATSVLVGRHIRVRGYDSLHSDMRSIETIIASHVSVIIHVHHVVHRKIVHKTVKKKATAPAVKTASSTTARAVPTVIA